MIRSRTVNTIMQNGMSHRVFLKTRQVVTYALGDRSEKTCHRLWEAIPSVYRANHCFTGFWVAYQVVLPEEQHRAVGKETGETARARTLEQYPPTALGSFCP